MADTLLGALAALMGLRRWNLVPRVETWVEAENIAHYTLVAWGIATELDDLNSDDTRTHLLHRCLLKSLNKHTLADTSIRARDLLRKFDPGAWKGIVDDAASETASLFPRAVAGGLAPYLTFEASYAADKRQSIEDLVTYCQYKVAEDELAPNERAFASSGPIRAALGDLELKLQALRKKGPYVLRYEEAFTDLQHYRATIRDLKYVTRWNRVNRLNETTVMGHTFMVAILALVFSKMADEQLKATAQPRDASFEYQCVRKALFHDVPESFTGDVITPVKDRIKRQNPKAWAAVEGALVTDFLDKMPKKVRRELEQVPGKTGLLEDFKSESLWSVDSLVKECDRLALVMECLFERATGSIGEEMQRAYSKYVSRLQRSEWQGIREYALGLTVEFPR